MILFDADAAPKLLLVTEGPDGREAREAKSAERHGPGGAAWSLDCEGWEAVWLVSVVAPVVILAVKDGRPVELRTPVMLAIDANVPKDQPWTHRLLVLRLLPHLFDEDGPAFEPDPPLYAALLVLTAGEGEVLAEALVLAMTTGGLRLDMRAEKGSAAWRADMAKLQERCAVAADHMHGMN